MTPIADDLQYAPIDLHSPYCRALAWVLSVALFVNPLGAATAQQIVVATGSTTVGAAANGVPVVNIAAPNAHGLSHNRYTDYNVGSQGLILNNATSALHNTQLAGYIIGNPQLNGQAASLILNEVTGGRPSVLAGYTEVAGQAARVVVANPWGLTCNGCGFINSPRVTLTTGTPRIEDGRLTAFRVEGGQILIEGAGLNASNIDQFDLVTRSAKINAELYARQLNIVTGRNEVAAGSLVASALAPDGGAPLFAIDSAALGGMYTNSIMLVGTEAGVGVRLAGDLGASAGDIRIDAAGHLRLARNVAAGAIDIAAHSVELAGATYAGGTADITAQAELRVADSLAAGGGIKLAAAELDNRGGLIESDTTLTLSFGSLDNRGGTLRALGPAGVTTLDGNALDNRGGTIESANQDFRLATASLQNGLGSVRHLGSGRFELASQAVTEAGGSFASLGTFALVADSWRNTSVLQANTLILDIGAFSQSAEGQLIATSGFVGNGNDWINDGRLASDGDLQLTLSGSYSGSGALASVGDLALAAADIELSSSSATVGAGGNAAVSAGATLANAGTLTAAGTLTLAAAALDNRGTLGSAGDLRIQAAAVANEGGLIFSGADMRLRVDRLGNRYADIYGLGDIDIAADDEGRAATLVDNASATIEAAGSLTLRTASLVNHKDLFTTIDEQTYGRMSVVCYDCSGDHHNVDYIATEVFESRIDQDSAAARIQSGGALEIDAGSVANRYSVIAAGGNLSLVAGSLENTGAAAATTTRVRTWNTGRVTDGTDERFRFYHLQPYNAASLPKQVPLGALAPFNLVGDHSTVSPTGAAAAAVVQAAGSAHVEVAGMLVNDIVVPQAAAAGEAATVVASLNPQRPPDPAQQPVDPVAQPAFSLPQGSNGLFHLAPGNHRYLIETNPALTGLSNFLNSDYLLGALGYDPDAAQRRLGDGLYEQHLVRDAVLARTGQRYLAGLNSDEAMYRHLMDNALASKEALQLAVGVSLSAEQVAALTHDIVWLEEQEVGGERVLVPVLYLAQAEGRLGPTGALVQGRDLTLIAGQTLANRGTLRADEDLSAAAGAVLNGGLMQAGERLSVLAEDSIVNTRGGILAGRDVDLGAVHGDIINERSVTAWEGAGRGFASAGTVVDAGARIEAQGNLSLLAGRDLYNLGSTLAAGGDLELAAGRDLVIGAVEDTRSDFRQDKRHTWSSASSTQIGAEVSAGGALTAVAQRDLAVVASRVSAGGDATLVAGNDLTLAAAADLAQSEYRYKSSRKKINAETLTVRQQAAQVEAGGALTLAAGQDLTLVASTARAGGEAYLHAGRELALLAAENRDYELYDLKKKGSWGSKKTRRDETTTVTQIGSAVSAEGDVSLASGADQRYQGAKLTSGADLTLDAGGDIVFEAVKDLEQESHEKSSSSWAWNSAKGRGTTDETVRLSELTAAGELVIQAAGKIRIDIPEVSQQTVSQTISALVEADPQLAWLQEMEQRGDIDWQRVKEVHDSFKYSHSGMGQVLGIVVAIVVTVLTWGAASAAVGTAASATAGSGTAMAAAAGGVAAGWGNAAVTAAVTSMASNTVINTINAGGDLGKALKLSFSEDALKGYATAALTAALTTGLIDDYFSDKANAGGSGANSTTVNVSTGTSTTSGAQVATGTGPSFNLNSWSGVGQFAAYQGTRAVVSSAVDTAINGGSFEDKLATALTSAAIHTVSAASFNQVGNLGLDNGSIEKVAVKALVGGLISQAATGDFATGALAAGANEALVEHLAALVDHDPQLLGMASQLVGAVSAGVSGGDASLGANLALYDTQYNRQLHFTEKQRARELAAQSDGRWTAEQVEDALRWADNRALNETYDSGMVVKLDGATTAEVYDAERSYVSNGYIIQDLNAIARPDAELMAFIQQNTGDTYAWNPIILPKAPADPTAGMAWTSNGYVPITDGTGGAPRYETFYADGQAYRLPVAECPSVVCTGGSAIAWGSTDAADQVALAAYARSANRQMLEDGAKLATVATLASPIGVSRLTLAGLASRQTAVAFGVGAGFQSAGDYVKTGEVDLGNSLIAGTTAALAWPVLGGSIVTNSLIGGATLGTNAMAQNTLLGANESVAKNYRLGLIFSGAGTIAGHGGTWAVGQFAPQFVRNVPLNPTVPTLLQAPAQLNPVPGQVGASIDALISNLPPFLDTSKQEGRP